MSSTSPGSGASASMGLSLDVVEARQAVAPAKSAEVDPELDAKATQMADMLANLDPAQASEALARKGAIESAGRELQRESGRRSRMLQEPIKTLSERGAEGGEVGQALVDLKMQVEALDPADFDFEPGWFSRALGVLPFVGTPLKRYFSQYESAQTVIDAILHSLEKGREQLGRDNVTLSEDQRVMRELTHSLERQVQLLRLIDGKLGYKLDREIPADDPRQTFI